MVVEEEEKAPPLHGDLLETILSHVSLFDLMPASHVSKAWQRAVASSVLDPARTKPWLILHLQSTRNPTATTAHAYDPHLRMWVKMPHVTTSHTCHLRASNSNHLHMISPSKLSLSWDALNGVWTSMGAPKVWRQDPIVAMVGSHVVVAGGTCEFEDDPLAVEVLDPKSGNWASCEPMPTIFKSSASASWLSVAASDHKIYVLEKSSGEFCSFNLNTMKWERLSELRPEPSLYFSSIAFARDRLILFGLAGDADNVTSLRLWEVNCDTLEQKEIGKMPEGMVGRLIKDADSPLSSIGVALAGDFAYVYNPSDPKEIFYCDFRTRICEWGSIQNTIVSDQNRLDRFIFTCSNVTMDDIKAISRAKSGKFMNNLAVK